VKADFHLFADAFHHDRHGGRPEDERRALSTIFKRGTEAYVVLSDDAMRTVYDERLAEPNPRPPRISFTPGSHTKPPSSARLEDRVRSATARPFARRAEELVRDGNYKQAKLQMVMANHHDPDNEALEAYLKEIEAKLAALPKR
jgi:DnaJ-class molecular chaperone